MADVVRVLIEMRWELALALPPGVIAWLLLAWVAFGRGDARLVTAPPRISSVNIFVLLAGVMVLLAGTAAAPTVLAVLGLDSPTRDPWHVGWQSVVVQMVTMLPVALLFAGFACHGRGARDVGLLPRRWGRELMVAAAAMALVLPAVFACNVVVITLGLLAGAGKPAVGHELLAIMQSADSLVELWPLFLSALVLAPVLEEVIFRGLVQTSLVQFTGLRRRRWVVIVMAAVIFTAIHQTVVWQVLPGLLLLGVVLGWLYERTGSLLPPVLVHIGFNVVNTIIALTLVPPPEGG